MNEQNLPTFLDLEDHLTRAVGIAASLHGCDPDMFNLVGLHGATEALYTELLHLQKLYYAAHNATQGGAA